MSSTDKANAFLARHRSGEPLLIPNPWDVGSARLLAHLGFEALATTSSGFAATLGRLDNNVTREEAIAHGGAIAAAVEIPVSADLENGFGPDPDDAAVTVRLAAEAGLAGCSIEDSTGNADDPLYDIERAADRIKAASEAARSDHRIVLTARAENFVVGRRDLDDTISRLQRYQEAGADVLFAPGIRKADDIRAVVSSIDLPLNVLVLPGTPDVAELAELGVARISVGGALAYAAYGAMVDAARRLKGDGTYSYWDMAGIGSPVVHEAFAD